MDYHSLTDIGKGRKINEDAYSNYFCSKFSIYLVADGMGGHKAGEVASKMAVQETQKFIIANKGKDEYPALLSNAIQHANEEIFKHQRQCEDCSNMGTTIVACLVSDKGLWTAHVGDSRAYIFHDDELRQITKDHSFVQSLIDRGLLSEKDVDNFPEKNAVTRALGIELEVEIDIDFYPLSDGDQILVATDGLTNLVEDDVIASILQRPITPKEKSEILLRLALENGGYDNITITLLQYRSEL